jgi:hypothetical protein
MTSFEVTFGHKSPSMLNYCSGTSAFEAVDTDLRSRDVILSQLTDNLLRSQTTMKFYTDKYRTAMTFEPGQLVLPSSDGTPKLSSQARIVLLRAMYNRETHWISCISPDTTINYSHSSSFSLFSLKTIPWPSNTTCS